MYLKGKDAMRMTLVEAVKQEQTSVEEQEEQEEEEEEEEAEEDWELVVLE